MDMSSYLEDPKQFLRKVQIGVEGSIGPYYWKHMICTQIKENFEDSKELVEGRQHGIT